jgi:hypothetical protein
MDEGACLSVKNIGKPCAEKPRARFDEGRLMDDQPSRHVVAACGEASIKVPATDLISASYSTHNLVSKVPRKAKKRLLSHLPWDIENQLT